MFEDQRVVPDSFKMEETNWYYYPKRQNRVDAVMPDGAAAKAAELAEEGAMTEFERTKLGLELEAMKDEDGEYLVCI